jgi:hypothetical protein
MARTQYSAFIIFTASDRLSGLLEFGPILPQEKWY